MVLLRHDLALRQLDLDRGMALLQHDLALQQFDLDRVTVLPRHVPTSLTTCHLHRVTTRITIITMVTIIRGLEHAHRSLGGGETIARPL